MTKKRDTVKKAKDVVKRDVKDTKKAHRNQGALVDRYVNQHTTEAARDWDNNPNPPQADNTTGT
ncbi:hypothetical protein ACWGDX_03165 [Streptomyces sp. NPDC055025]